MSWRIYLPQPWPDTVVGADEVGYGALAGPMVVAAVVAPITWYVQGLNDSKKLSHSARQLLLPSIKDLVVCEGLLQAEEVDRRGGYQGLIYLHAQVVKTVQEYCPGSTIFVDGTMQIEGVISLPKADAIIPVVMAASVHAKEYRDTFMATTAHQMYPEYGFDSNKGYGTYQHYAALTKYGPCPLHRRSFLKFHDGNVVMPKRLLENPPSPPRVPSRCRNWPTLRRAKGSNLLRSFASRER